MSEILSSVAVIVVAIIEGFAFRDRKKQTKLSEHQAKIDDTYTGANGIKITNTSFVLRYVIGV